MVRLRVVELLSHVRRHPVGPLQAGKHTVAWYEGSSGFRTSVQLADSELVAVVYVIFVLQHAYHLHPTPAKYEMLCGLSTVEQRDNGMEYARVSHKHDARIGPGIVQMLGDVGIDS